MDAETYADYKQLTVDLFHYFFNYDQKNHGSIKTKYSSLETEPELQETSSSTLKIFPDKYGYSVMHYAAQKNNEQLLNFLASSNLKVFYHKNEKELIIPFGQANELVGDGRCNFSFMKFSFNITSII